jgi:hypothetical protein
VLVRGYCDIKTTTFGIQLHHHDAENGPALNGEAEGALHPSTTVRWGEPDRVGGTAKISWVQCPAQRDNRLPALLACDRLGYSADETSTLDDVQTPNDYH